MKDLRWKMIFLLIGLGFFIVEVSSSINPDGENDLVRQAIRAQLEKKSGKTKLTNEKLENPAQKKYQSQPEKKSGKTKMMKEKLEHPAQKYQSQPEKRFIPPPAESFCDQPGYTGASCEFPICSSTNPDLPDPIDPTSQTFSIDYAVFDYCNGSFPTILDTDLSEIVIVVTTESQNPSFDLINSTGYVMPPKQNSPNPTSLSKSYDPLPPGNYAIHPSAAQGRVPCSIDIRARTTMVPDGGFVAWSVDMPQPERIDFPNPSQALIGTPNVFVVTMRDLRAPGYLQTVTIYEGDQAIARQVRLSTRFACTYQYFYQSYTCPERGTFTYRVDGVDFFGNPFRRLQAFLCILPPVTTTTTAVTFSPPASTTPSDPNGPSSCRNNGVLIKGIDGIRFCYCLGLFRGPDCNEIICMNSGIPSTNGVVCVCRDGFAGPHCQNVVCPILADPDFTADRPTLTFVIRSTTGLSAITQQIAEQVRNITGIVQGFDPEYMTKFALTVFNNGNIIYSQTFTSINLFYGALISVANTSTSTGGCSDIVFTAVTNTITALSLGNRSPIYVYSDALPNDYEENMESIFHINSYRRLPIYFTYVEPPVENGCSTGVSFDPAFRAMSELSNRFSGQTFYVARADRDNVGSLFYNHFYATFYRSQLVISNDAQQCSSQPQYQPFTVDQTVHTMRVVAIGNDLRLILTTPDGDSAQANVGIQLGTTYVWYLTGLQPGPWLITILSGQPATACSYRIYSTNVYGGTTGFDYDFFWSMTQDINQDATVDGPIVGLPYSFVAHLSNYNFTFRAETVTAELTIYTNRNGVREIHGASNGIYRARCNYGFYFSGLSCRRPNELLYFSFFVRDRVGFMIQRSGSMYCSAVPTTPRPPGDCQNGGVPINGNNGTTCICPQLFTGSKCETRLCLEGGTLIGAVCRCPPGHAGDSCEITTCLQLSNQTEFSHHRRGIAFVMELTFNTAIALKTIDRQIDNIIRDIQLQHPDWIGEYIFAGFNSTFGGIIRRTGPQGAQSVAQAMHDAINALDLSSNQSCSVMLWQALDEVTTVLGQDALIWVWIASVPNEDVALTTFQVYNRIAAKRILMNTFLGISGLNGGQFVCSPNATWADYGMLMETSEISGQIYVTQFTHWTDLILIIPSFYMNGLLYEVYYPNCTQSIDVYFAVDSWTQSLQLLYHGFDMTYTFQPENSDEFTGGELIAYDPLTAIGVVELRRRCDTDWDDLGSQSCLKFIFQRNTWDEARQFCAHAGAYLVDELDADKDIYLQNRAQGFDIWIGLNNKLGDFVWDRPNGSEPSPLNQTVYANWADGQPGAGTGNCVVRRHLPDPMNSPGKWYVEPCDQNSTIYAFACQKHRYDQDFQPVDLTDEDLPPGKWKLTVQARPTGQQDPSCYIELRAQSAIQVYAGFTLDPHSDQPDVDPVADNPANLIITHLDGVDDPQHPGLLTHALIYSDNLTLQNAVTYEQRGNCIYKWMSQPWSCFSTNNIINQVPIQHVGKDQFGFTFQRMSTGNCVKKFLACQNFGTIYQGVCICPPYWTGQQCEIPICINGTLDSTNNLCQCIPGFTGAACQYAMCQPQVPATFENDKKTLIVLIDLTGRNLPMIQKIRDNFRQWLMAMAVMPTWFEQYRIITFNSENCISCAVPPVPDIDAAVNLLNSLTTAVTDNTTDCGRPLYGTLAAAASLPGLKIPGSQAWLFTSGIATDAGNANMALEFLSRSGMQFNYVVVDDTFKACDYDIANINVAQFGQFVMASGGNTFFLDVATFMDFIISYTPTVYSSAVLFNNPPMRSNCTDQPWYFQVDRAMTFVYIDIHNILPSLSITDPSGALITLTSLYDLGFGKPTKVRYFRIGDQTQYTGIYKIQVNGPGSCSVQVRGISTTQVFRAFTQPRSENGIHQDDAFVDPIINSQNIILAHLTNGNGGGGGTLLYAELFTYPANIADQSVTIMPLYWRRNCSYEYFSDPFVCPDTVFGIQIHGFDDAAQLFRRITFAVCVNSREVNGSTVAPLTTGSTTTTQPATGTTVITTTTTTQPGTGPTEITTTTTTQPATGPTTSTAPVVTADVVVMIDASSSMSNASYEEAKQFVYELLSEGFTISQAAVRVALYPVPGNSSFPFAFAYLQTINGPASLRSHLTSMFYEGSAGQQLGMAINDVASDNFKGEGYRNRTLMSNHLVLYITGTSNFTGNGNPVLTAGALRGQGVYGFMVIRYKSDDDTAPLQGISGVPDCLLFAADSTALSGLKSRVQQKIRDAYFTTNGVYCP